jgi:hypothetical protein
MKYKPGIAVAALAAIILLMALATSMQYGKGDCKAQNNALWMNNNYTDEELNNMTLGELHALGQKQMQDLNFTGLHNAIPSEFNDSKVFQNRTDCMGTACRGMGCRALGELTAKRGHINPGRSGLSQRGAAMRGHGLEFLLMDDIDAEKLNNMTISQINELQQKKIQELRNMTAAQIMDLKQKRMRDRQNITLGELKKRDYGMDKIAGFFMRFGSDLAEFTANEDIRPSGGHSRH